MKSLFIVTAALEMPTGIALLVSPPLVARILLGATLDAPAAVIVGRLAGAALFSLGAACWMARNDGESRAGAGVVAAMLCFNVASAMLLAYAGAGLGLLGILLWPAVAGHSALAVWCLVGMIRIWQRIFPAAGS